MSDRRVDNFEPLKRRSTSVSPDVPVSVKAEIEKLRNAPSVKAEIARLRKKHIEKKEEGDPLSDGDEEDPYEPITEEYLQEQSEKAQLLLWHLLSEDLYTGEKAMQLLTTYGSTQLILRMVKTLFVPTDFVRLFFAERRKAAWRSAVSLLSTGKSSVLLMCGHPGGLRLRSL